LSCVGVASCAQGISRWSQSPRGSRGR
jgi:hypothetical protein